MVDKENQWDEVEYTGDDGEYEDSLDDDVYSDEEYETDDSEEYSDEEYEYEDDEYEYEDEEPQSQRKSNGGCAIIVLLLIILLLAAGGYFAYAKFFKGDSISKEPASSHSETYVQEQQNNAQDGNNSQDMGDFFFNEAGGNDGNMMSVDFNQNNNENNQDIQVPENNGENVNNEPIEMANEAPQEEKKPQEQNQEGMSPDDIFAQGNFNEEQNEGSNDIMVSYNTETRANPFKPPVVDKNIDLGEINETGFEIIEPPTSSIQDENLQRLLQTQISGILFDELSPSAIVNLNGVDQFVKIGDKVSGYIIENITRNKVQISYKNNSYTASVGELFTRGLLEKQPAVVNFENKFAGRYRENN